MMACEIFIDEENIIGHASATGEISSVDVNGTANCDYVILETNCNKPSTTRVEVVNGEWSTSINVPAGRCNCSIRMVIKATCENDPDCRAIFEGIVHCVPEEKPRCPTVLIVVFKDGIDVTEQIVNQACIDPGLYDFVVSVNMPAPISLELQANGIDIDLATDPRITNLAADNSQFTFNLDPATNLIVTAAVYTPDCGIETDAIELTGCEAVCPEGRDYNSCTKECCPPGTRFNPDTCECESPRCPPNTDYNPTSGECCPEGQRYNPQTEKCEDREPPTRCPPNTDYNPTTGECCPEGQRYNPRTQSCEDRLEPPESSTFCCSGWKCWLIFGALALITAGVIIAAFNCFFFEDLTALTDAITAAIAAGAAASTTAIALGLLGLIGIGSIALIAEEFCDACCIACALWLGIIVAVIWFIIQTIFSGLPACWLTPGVPVFLGALIPAIIFTRRCNRD